MSSSSYIQFVVVNNTDYINATSPHVFLPVWVSSLSLSNSAFFLVCYTVLLSSLGMMVSRIKRNQSASLKRNPKILFSLITIFVLIQMSCLTVRTVFDSLHIIMKQTIDLGDMVTKSMYVAYSVLGSISSFLMLFNYIFLLVIMFFVQSIL